MGIRPSPLSRISSRTSLSNFSIRPAVSISFCLPVKNGWQLEQMATLISSATDIVSKVFPQAHFTVAGTYFGCVFSFIVPIPFCRFMCSSTR
ncbi:MAG: hypothetical protein H6Q81_2002 [Deltaproteobacteria bacterium]|nr:hypothetical protein [Deltaproteobacteria bacterium]